MKITRILAVSILTGMSCFGSALIDAVQNDDQAQVTELLSQQVNVNTQEDDGSTALAWAAVRCNTGITTLLLKANADPNLTNEHGIGPLSLAITNGSPAIVQLLLARGANPNL